MRIAPRPFFAPVALQAFKTAAQIAKPINPAVERLAVSLMGTFNLKRNAHTDTKPVVLSIREPLAADDVGAFVSLIAPELLRKGAVIERLALPVTANGSKSLNFGSLELHREPRVAGLDKALDPEQIAAHLLADDLRRGGKATMFEKNGEKWVHFTGSRSAYAIGLDLKRVFAELKELRPDIISHVGSVSIHNLGKGSQPILKPRLHVEFVPSFAVLQSGRLS